MTTIDPDKIDIRFFSTAGNYFITDENGKPVQSIDPNFSMGKKLIERYTALSGIDNSKEWVEQKKTQTYEIEGLKAERTRLQEHAQALLVDLKQERERIAKLEEALRDLVKKSTVACKEFDDPNDALDAFEALAKSRDEAKSILP